MKHFNARFVCLNTAIFGVVAFGLIMTARADGECNMGPIDQPTAESVPLYKEMNSEDSMGLNREIEPNRCMVCGSREENEFIECYIRCAYEGGHGQAACYRTCCQQVAGCTSCIFC